MIEKDEIVMWKCDKCGEMNNDNTTQCERCGSKRTAQPGWKCSRCGEMNDGSKDQCCKCGSKRSAVKLSPTPGPASDPVPDPTPDPKPSDPPRTDHIILPADDYPNTGEIIKRKDVLVSQYRGLAVSATILQFLLFALKYTYFDYTIYRACAGYYGSIEQICSFLLVTLTIVPAITVLVKLDVRKRNLPITISAITASLTTVYCLVIWFGNPDSTVVPALIILLAWGVVFFAYKYAKALNEIDNTMLHRPTSF